MLEEVPEALNHVLNIIEAPGVQEIVSDTLEDVSRVF